MFLARLLHVSPKVCEQNCSARMRQAVKTSSFFVTSEMAQLIQGTFSVKILMLGEREAISVVALGGLFGMSSEWVH